MDNLKQFCPKIGLYVKRRFVPISASPGRRASDEAKKESIFHGCSSVELLVFEEL